MATKLIPFDQVLAEALEHPETRAEWDRAQPASMLATALIRYRADCGLSQRDFAKLLGISQVAVARREASEKLPRLDTLQRICRVIGREATVHISVDGKIVLSFEGLETN